MTDGDGRNELGTRNMQIARSACWTTALAMVLAVLLGGNMGSFAAEAGGGDIKGANTSGDQPARSRPPYVGVWGIWKEAPQWSMYWSGLHALYFGIDFWNIERLAAMDGPEFVPAYEFFTRHAGCHDPAEAEGAWVALRDGLDADDTDRFPEDRFGKVHPWWLQTKENSTQRYVNIAKAFAAFGAAQDPDYEPAFYNKSFQLPHLNDVGWEIVHGNYQMYLTQHDPLGTSQGYWRVGPKSQPYGRFARGFNGFKGMNAMYFDLDDKFYSGGPPHGCTLRVVYYDQGVGRWALQYDATGNPQQTAVIVTKTNSGTWKEVTVDIADGNFQNRCPHNTDIMLTNMDDEDDVFHMIELTRASAFFDEAGARLAAPQQVARE